MTERSCTVNQDDIYALVKARFQLAGEVVQHVRADRFHLVLFGDEPATPLDDHSLTHDGPTSPFVMRMPLMRCGKVS